MLTCVTLAQVGRGSFGESSSGAPVRYKPATSSYQDYGSNHQGYAEYVTAHPRASDESTPVPMSTRHSTHHATPAGNSYSGNNLQTSESVAAEARQFASALAASFSGMDVAEGEQRSTPEQPVTPQQVSTQQEEEWAQPVTANPPETPEPQDHVNLFVENRSGSLQVSYSSMDELTRFLPLCTCASPSCRWFNSSKATSDHRGSSVKKGTITRSIQ